MLRARACERGGTGVRYEADVLVPCTWSFRAEGLDTAIGLMVSKEEVPVPSVSNGSNRSDDAQFTPPKYGVRRLGPARIVADTPGGGGWGDPFTRAASIGASRRSRRRPEQGCR